jgi:hypothetical protein
MSDLSLLFESLLSNLRASECLRERISKRKSFPLPLAFDYCDFDGDGFLSCEDLKRVLIENGAAQQAKDKEVVLIINKFKNRGARARYGYGVEARVSREEYVKEVMPKIVPYGGEVEEAPLEEEEEEEDF